MAPTRRLPPQPLSLTDRLPPRARSLATPRDPEPPAPPAERTAVLVDKMGDYFDWAQRHPDIDAVPYAVGGKLPTAGSFTRFEIAREVHPLVRWCLEGLTALAAPDGGAVNFEDWPAST